MRNLFIADYFKNVVANDTTKDLDVVKRWLCEGQKVVCRMRELSSYFELERDFEVEDIVTQYGEIYVKAVGYLFPFVGFADNVHVLRSWKFSDVSRGKIDHNYVRDLDVAKQYWKEGKVLVCVFEGGATSYVASFESMGGVDYITTHCGSKYILEPLRPSRRFGHRGVLQWPSDLA